jgi:CDP-2,3-bis-(O-geranylgeranyl)-sn-glycerol synthase
MSIIFLLSSAFYFFLPGLVANMMASLTRRIKFLKFFDKPLDFGKKLKDGNYILGQSKTWRGAFFGPLFGILFAFLQLYLFRFSFFRQLSIINYQQINIILFSLLMTFGAIFGDLVFSFFKRRINKKSGQSWMPFDQLDFVVGSFLFLNPYLNFYLHLNFSVFHWLAVAFVAFLAHIITNNIAYYFGWQKNRW